MLWLLLVLGCSFSARTQKFLAAERHVTASETVGELATVSYGVGRRNGGEQPYDPQQSLVGGRMMSEVSLITSDGWVRVEPVEGPVSVSVWVRHMGLARRDFRPVTSVTGGMHRAIPNEVRFLPTELETAWVLPMHQLHNVYNGTPMSDGDLLLIEVRDDAGVERYVFRSQEFGVRTKASAGVLFTVPLPFLPNPPDSVTPVFVVTLAAGYRPKTRHRALRWLGGHVAVVGSLGLGSTTLEDVAGGPVQDQVLGAFNAALGGGGLEFYDMVSVQALANLSALSRDVSEAPWTITVGFDAVQFSVFARSAGTRLLRANTLDRKEDALHGVEVR